MLQRFVFKMLLLGLMLLSPVIGLASADYMHLKFHNYVNDYAHMLSPQKIESLDQKLSAYDKQTSNQIVVTTLTSIGDDTVEDVANALFQLNGIGTKQHDNGVLLLIVKDGHHIRIEVGYGLEGELTDALSGMIIRNNIAPQFKQGDFDAGVQAGVNSMIQAIGGTYKAKPNHNAFWVDVIGGPIFLIVVIYLVVSSIVNNYKADGWKGALLGLLFSRTYSSDGTYTSSDDGDDDGFSGGGGGSGGGGASGGW